MPHRSKYPEVGKAELELLVLLVEEGPMLEDYVPFKLARNCLVKNGLAAKIIHKGNFGFTAATEEGGLLYMKVFGDTQSLSESRKHRIKEPDILSRLQSSVATTRSKK